MSRFALPSLYARIREGGDDRIVVGPRLMCWLYAVVKSRRQQAVAPLRGDEAGLLEGGHRVFDLMLFKQGWIGGVSKARDESLRLTSLVQGRQSEPYKKPSFGAVFYMATVGES